MKWRTSLLKLQQQPIFIHQGAKLDALCVNDPPFVTKMDLIMDTDHYDLEGPTPDIWFALQVHRSDEN